MMHSEGVGFAWENIGSNDCVFDSIIYDSGIP